MAISGSELFRAAKPVLDEGCTDLMDFRTKMGAKISSYVAANAELKGAYAGTTPGGSPVIGTAVGKLVPTAPTPPLLANPVPFTDYKTWIKKTLEETVLWNIVAVTPYTNTPMIFDPTVTFIDVLGDFSDLRTSEGFWAMVCDAIICCIEGYIPTTTPGAKSGSSGTILWTPIEIPEVVHNFIFRINYDINDNALIRWIKKYITDIGDVSGTVDIPFEDKPYQEVITIWKGLIALTTECELYKKQDYGDLILLTTGAAF